MAAMVVTAVPFQSTPPRERRLACSIEANGMLQFQSTPPRERRLKVALVRHFAVPVSIHASA